MKLPLVIEPEQLHQAMALDNLVIIDLSSDENYLAAHIPGAVHISPSRLLRGEGPIPNLIPDDSQLSALFSDCGITKSSQVVVYDDQNGPWAGRFIWSMHCCGLYQTSFLNGQLAAWIQHGYPTEQIPNEAEKSDIQVRNSGKLLADKNYIQNHLNDDSISIWDARSKAEYTGEKIVNASKGGHIPSAHWFEWTETLESLNPPRLAGSEELRENIRSAGIEIQKEVVTHCQTHRRSGLTYIAALHAGIEKIRCYDGSWFEWGNDKDTPVEQ